MRKTVNRDQGGCVRLPIISEEEGNAMMREFYKNIIVRFYKDYDGWFYEVTGFAPPHQGTQHFSGPFQFKFQAWLDYRREFITRYRE